MRTLTLLLLLAAPAFAADLPAAPTVAVLGSPDRKLVTRPVAVRVHAGEPRVSVLTSLGGIQTWDLRTGKLVGEQRIEKTERDSVHAAIFSPDGRWVFAGLGESGVVQHDTRTRKTTPVKLGGPAKSGLSGAFAVSRDGKTIVLKALPAPDPAAALAVPDDAPRVDAEQLIVGTVDDEGFREGRRVPAAHGPSVAVSDDGRLIADLSMMKPKGNDLLPSPVREKNFDWSVRLTDAATGKFLRTFDLPAVAAVGPFSPDGSRLLTSSFTHKTQLWDVATGRVVREWPAPLGGGDSRFTPDGTGVFVGGSVNGVPHYRLVRTGTGDTVRDFPVGGKWSRRSDVTADGTTLVTVDDATVRLWDVATAKERFPAPGHAGRVAALAFLPDGSGVVTGGDDGTARVWSLPAGAEAHRLPPLPTDSDAHPPVSAVAVSADGATVAVGQRSGGLATVRLWDRHRNRVIESPAGQALFPQTAVIITGAINAADPERLAPQQIQQMAYEAGSHVCRVLAGNQIVRLSPEAKPLGPAAAMPREFGKGEQALIRDETAVAVAAGVGVAYYEGHEFDELRVWDFAKNEVRASLRLADNVRPRVSAVAPNGRFAVLYDARSGPTKAMFVYDLATLNELGRLTVATPLGFSPPCVVSADSRLCAMQTGRQPARFTVFDVARFAPLAVVADPNRTARLAFSADGRRAATGGPDSLVRVHDLRAALDPAPPAFDPAACWADLVSADGAAATRAVYRLADRPAEAVKLFRERLKPAAKPAAADVAAWVKALDAPAFAARQAATKKLTAAADVLEAELKQEAATNASPESAQAITTIQDAAAKARRRLEGEALRAYRVVQVLEAIGPPAAGLLTEYAAGAKGAFLTQEAAAARDRRK